MRDSQDIRVRRNTIHGKPFPNILSPMSHHIVMFDIDGTLVHAGGAGRRAIVRAFRDLSGIDEVQIPFSMAGLTDWAIMRRVHAANAHVKDPRVFDERREALFARYLECLAEEMVRGNGARIFPGVRELLTALAARPDVTLALLTGNLEGGARIKLAPFGLNRFFAVGGYGSDAEEREAVYQAAMARLPLAAQESRPAVTIVGDTPHDIRVAACHGVRSIGVATGGHYTLEELAAAGAGRLFADLADTPAVLAALGLEKQ